MRFLKLLRFVMEPSTFLRTESGILRDISRAAEGVITEIIGPSVMDVRFWRVNSYIYNSYID